MKAAIIDRYGSTEVLQIKEVDKPQIESDQMLVKVHASSVNPIDWKIRKGLLKNRSGNEFPMLLGYDVSGEVIEVGDRIDRETLKGASPCLLGMGLARTRSSDCAFDFEYTPLS